MLFGKTLTCCFQVLFLLAVPFPALAEHASRYDYVVQHGDVPIGSHRVNVIGEGKEFGFVVESFLEVRFGPLTVFRFEHQRLELWRDGTEQQHQGRANILHHLLAQWYDANSRSSVRFRVFFRQPPRYPVELGLSLCYRCTRG